jgi:membrane protease YdiL (CAAX protease family)
MNAAPGEVCGVCAAPLRAAARFCGRCGATHGAMVPRELGAGAEDASVLIPASAPPVSSRGLAVALASYFAVLVPVMVVVVRPESPSVDRFLTVTVITALVGLVGLAALGRRGWATLVPRRWRLADAARALVAVAAVVGIAVVLERWSPWLFVDLTFLLVDARWSLATTILVAAILPAVAEELVYRGAMFTGLRDVLSEPSAIGATALVYAVPRLSIPSLLHLTTLGLVLGWTRARTGSVWPCVLLHAGYNVALVLLW